MSSVTKIKRKLRRRFRLLCKLMSLTFVIACSGKSNPKAAGGGGSSDDTPAVVAGADSQATISEPIVNVDYQFFFDSPEQIDYATVDQHVFDAARCTACHSDTGSTPDHHAIGFGADLSNFGNLEIHNGISPGWPETTTVISRDGTAVVVQGSNCYEVETEGTHPAVEGYQPMSAEQKELLRLWVLNCAVEEVPEPDYLHDAVAADGKIRRCH